MQLSLRSQMIAGVAAIGATAIAVTPIAQPDLLATPQRVSAAIQLSAFANPVTELLGNISLASQYLFYQDSLPGFDDLYWPDSFYNTDFTYLYAPGYYGLLPDAVNQFSFGALSAVLNNLSGYIDTAVFGTVGALGGVSDAVFNTPFALIDAAQLALAGQIDAAIAELQAQILAPLQGGLETGFAAVGYILDNVITNATTLVTDTLPRLVAGLIDSTVGAATYLFQTAIDVATNIATNLASLNIEGAWNAAVEGLLNPGFGLLGSAVALKLGVGIFEEVEYEDVGFVETVVYPSARSVLTSVGQRLGDFSALGDGGILNDPFFVPTAAAVSAPAAAAPEADAAPAEVAVVTPVEVAAPVEVVAPVEVADTREGADSIADSAPTLPAVAEDPAADSGSAAAEPAPSRAKAPASRASDRAAKSSDRATKGSARAAKAAAGA
jgi:hypothetical protein